MKLVIAVREQSASKARGYLDGLGAEVLKSRYETQEPALRNLVDGLLARGLVSDQAAGYLFWYLIESPLPAEHWLAHESVAVCFSHLWLQQQMLSIRYLKGVAYCDACADWAQQLPFDQQPVQKPCAGALDWRGLPNLNVASSVAEADEPKSHLKSQSKPRFNKALKDKPCSQKTGKKTPKKNQATKPSSRSMAGHKQLRPVLSPKREEQLDLFA